MSFSPKVALQLCWLAAAAACTNFIVTKGASVEGHNSFSYTDDGGNNYGEITLLPAADHPAGSMRKIWRWEDGKYLGEIPEAPHTYRVVGNMNEHQLAIGETTFTGKPELRNPMEIATMDYANLMSISLQRARTAREAITLMDQLTKDYGYASTGESFTISDPTEIWHYEIVGRGPEKGAVWVARLVPDGYVGGHANQARITTFPLDEPETTLFSPDIFDWARRAGYYPADAADADFDFSAAFDPVSFHGARYGEVRVWDFFQRLVGGNFGNKYLNYARGYELERRMPLWVKPDRPVSLNDTFWYMRSHFEGTPFDMTTDLGAGPYGAAYRARPTAWKVNGVEYVNERPVATQQTGFHFVAVMRTGMPDAVGGVSWYGVDDTSHSSRIPVYAGVTAVPAGWTRTPLPGAAAAHATTSSYWTPGTADEAYFSADSAFWVHNLVANLVYGRWSAHAEVQSEIEEAEGDMLRRSRELERHATALFRAGRADEAQRVLTDFTVRAGQELTVRWRELWVRLVVKFRDGFVISQNESKPNGDLAATVAAEVGYPAAWYARIAAADGQALAAPVPTVSAVAIATGAELNEHECARGVCSLDAGGSGAFRANTGAAGRGAASKGVSVSTMLVAMGVSLVVGAAVSGVLVHAAARRTASQCTALEETGPRGWPLARAAVSPDGYSQADDYQAF